MKEILLDYLVCPNCQHELTCEAALQTDDDIEYGSLMCRNCAADYDIIRGIPRFVSEEHQLAGDNVKTAEAFGWEWQEFTELHDLNTYEAQFKDWISPIQPEFFVDKVVLDAGCGMGRFALVSSRFGARLVLAVDASPSVEAAQANAAGYQNVHVIQADIHRLPFRNKEQAQIDFIFSIGVLHHLDDPQTGFDSLVRHLKKTGSIFAWVYGRENNGWLVNAVNPIRTMLTSRLPHRVLYMIAWLITVVFQPILRLTYRPANEHSSMYWLQGLLPYNDYFAWLSGFGFRHNHHVFFDHLVAPVAFYISRREFERWFKEAGLQIIDISWRNRNSWRGHGKFNEPVEITIS